MMPPLSPLTAARTTAQQQQQQQQATSARPTTLPHAKERYIEDARHESKFPELYIRADHHALKPGSALIPALA